MGKKKNNEPEVEHIFVRGEGGAVFKLDLPLHESIEERLAKGYIQRVANADGDPYVEGADTPKVVEPPKERPALSAPKRVWVAWAGVNGMDLDEAEAATKDDLIEKFGKDPVPPPPPAGAQGTDNN